MKPELPAGRLKAKRRSFQKVVADLRFAVFSVVRHRRHGEGFNAHALGSGFFVSSSVFLTCHHVINPVSLPHQDGDTYHLVGNLGADKAALHIIADARIGTNVHLFNDLDLALLVVQGNQNQAYVALEYGDVPVGQEIGVAGYPIPTLIVKDGRLTYDGLLYRVAKGNVTSTYRSNIVTDQQVTLQAVPVVEVNFLFVPGNSGGPIFDAETGRVLGYVHGYRAEKIRERVETVTLIPELPAEIGQQYVESVHAIYSLGIKLDYVRNQLEGLGVTL